MRVSKGNTTAQSGISRAVSKCLQCAQTQMGNKQLNSQPTPCTGGSWKMRAVFVGRTHLSPTRLISTDPPWSCQLISAPPRSLATKRCKRHERQGRGRGWAGCSTARLLPSRVPVKKAEQPSRRAASPSTPARGVEGKSWPHAPKGTVAKVNAFLDLDARIRVFSPI